jgi:hypothetical protein
VFQVAEDEGRIEQALMVGDEEIGSVPIQIFEAVDVDACARSLQEQAAGQFDEWKDEIFDPEKPAQGVTDKDDGDADDEHQQSGDRQCPEIP